MRVHKGASWLWERPIVLIIGALIVITIFSAARGIIKNNEKENNEDESESATGEGAERSPMISLPYSILIFLLFTWVMWEATRIHDGGAEYGLEAWPLSVKQFPLVAALPGLVLVFFVILKDWKEYMATIKEHGRFSTALAHAVDEAILYRAMLFFGYLIAMILVMLIIGQKLALPLYIATYLFRWGNYNWRIAVGYAVGSWIFLVGFYDRIMHLAWHPSWLDSWLPEHLPSWLPPWFFF
jgi:ABC-type uncharacterized transport system fused permease/ATPase subunit